MTVEHLKINLPYEFHDFINESRKKYVFDYCLLEMHYNDDGRPFSMDLMAAAAPKEKLQEYTLMIKHAGFKLTVAAPEIFAYSNLIRAYEAEEQPEETREYCFVDLGYYTTKLHIFSSHRFEVTREIDHGCSLLDRAVADERNLDEHIAHAYVTENYEDVWSLPCCQDIFDTIAVEIMRAINFYGFNNPASRLDTVYFCGGGSLITPLVDTVVRSIPLAPRPVAELFKTAGQLPPEAFTIPAAAGLVRGRSVRDMFTVRKNEYPSKQTVNLVFRERSINSPSRAIPAFLLFLVFLALFVRFGVQGQLQKMTSAQASLEKVQADLSGLVEYNRDYEAVREQYSQYFNDYLNEDEAVLRDRLDVLTLLDRI